MTKINTADHFDRLTKEDKEILLHRIHERVDKNSGTGCWEWTRCKFTTGYGQISLRRDGFKFNMRAHRLSYQLHHDDSFSGFLVRHRCNNVKCCNPAHLIHGTGQDNIDDMKECGNHPLQKYNQCGSGNFNSSFTDCQVIVARRMYKTGKHTHQTIADLLKVSRRQLGKAITGITYTNLDEVESPAPPNNR